MKKLTIKDIKKGDKIVVRVKQWNNYWTVIGEVISIDMSNVHIKGFKWNKGVIVKKDDEVIYRSMIYKVEMVSFVDLIRLQKFYDTQNRIKDAAKEIFNRYFRLN